MQVTPRDPAAARVALPLENGDSTMKTRTTPQALARAIKKAAVATLAGRAVCEANAGDIDGFYRDCIGPRPLGLEVFDGDEILADAFASGFVAEFERRGLKVTPQ